LPEIINLLHAKTAYNFTLYKQGTLRRRIERRMGLATIEVHDMVRYLKLPHSDPQELDLLAKDLLINVTSFFRDPKVFDFLAEKIIPDLIGGQTPDHILRVWVAGCSTGEETYSLVMLLREAITAAKRNIKLQVFASDVDPDFDGYDLFLVCFIDALEQQKRNEALAAPEDVSHVAELQEELEATRNELQAAIRNLEISNEEQKAVNEDALSDNEEVQSTNEELRTSKDELQSMNEELTALNGQLQETLDRQRTTSNDLQNVLYSTDIATLFLDTQLKIRFYTPATKSLFNIIPSDIGRSISDLHSLVSDDALAKDASTVLSTLASVEQEIETQAGACYLRRILPYRTQDNRIEGVVVTFADITERKSISDALAAAKRQAELANVAKSRFLAAASHDLRQPLQTLSLIRGLLQKRVRENKTEEALKLIQRLDDTADGMSSMLNRLLDINQIDSGNVSVNLTSFPINELLDRLRDEFSYHAQSHNLAFRVVACGLSVKSDVRLLEQMLRNILANALKYTTRGKVLLGCRRHAGMLTVEVCDTGPGIPEGDFQAIFEEYHQLDNAAASAAVA